jgi:hypothetical protein
VRRDDFKKRGKSNQLFGGVSDWFTQASGYVNTQGRRSSPT